MTFDPAAIANAYIGLWNQKDHDRRRSMLVDGWCETATYIDPMAAATGTDAISSLVDAVHQRFPDFRFSLLEAADGHDAYVRFSWGLGQPGSEPPIKGLDFVRLVDGKIESVVGFLDRVPSL